MKKRIRRFTAGEIEGFKDFKLHHLQAQKPTEEQLKYWRRKPYSTGGK